MSQTPAQHLKENRNHRSNLQTKYTAQDAAIAFTENATGLPL